MRYPIEKTVCSQPFIKWKHFSNRIDKGDKTENIEATMSLPGGLCEHMDFWKYAENKGNGMMAS